MKNRREFLAATAATGALFASPAWADRAVAGSINQALELGLDNFAVRAMQWKAKELIDYAAQLQVDSLFITDLNAFENFNDDYLLATRDYAGEKEIALYVGTWSICPTSVTFKKDWGTAAEHLSLGIRVAKTLGSPVIRVVLGSRGDRTTAGGIRARIADTVQVLKNGKREAVEAGVRIAMENHAGDMHSLELVDLIEAAGPDFVGVNLDSGNALWTLEDPQQNLENLGRYVLTTSLRDAVAWVSDKGVTAQWTAMGEGQVDWPAYFARFAELCPNAPVHIETISGFNHQLPVESDEFWKAWPEGKPQGYDKFLEFAARGKLKPIGPKGDQQSYQRGELERSLTYCRKIGLGRKDRT